MKLHKKTEQTIPAKHINLIYSIVVIKYIRCIFHIDILNQVKFWSLRKILILITLFNECFFFTENDSNYKSNGSNEGHFCGNHLCAKQQG